MRKSRCGRVAIARTTWSAPDGITDSAGAGECLLVARGLTANLAERGSHRCVQYNARLWGVLWHPPQLTSPCCKATRQLRAGRLLCGEPVNNMIE